MIQLSGSELQAARKTAAERFTAIAMRYVPEGYTIEYRKSLSGRHFGQRKLIQAPRPVTRKSLYIFLHECAHATLHMDCKKPVHVLHDPKTEQRTHPGRHGKRSARVTPKRQRPQKMRRIA